MCLIIFANNYHPKYKLVVAANRDEFYERPTSLANFWEDEPNILAGRDLKEGGTWLGVNTLGYFAALTNYRDPTNQKDIAPSRGQLVKNYLASNINPTDYIANLPEGGVAYNGFNLLLADYHNLYYYSNLEKEVRLIPKGVHGLSNNLLNIPWPKVSKGIKNLEEILAEDDVNVDELFKMMADREQAEDSKLPDTGVGLELERILAPAFVTSPNYGTRLTTVILIDYSHNIKFWERTFINHEPNKWDEVYYEIPRD